MLTPIPADQWRRPAADALAGAREAARAVVRAVEAEGDAAVERFSQQFDGFAPECVALQPFEAYGLAAPLADALRLAADRIEAFARFQRAAYADAETEDATGVYGQRVVPLASMGAYVPGGRFPLVSTALMTLVPARVAGVGVRVAVSPSNHPAVLAACSLAGATAFVRVGGAQAVAALALGSRWHPAVQTVVGPGNAYVAAAKAAVADRVRIDTLAGPSEVLILADSAADPAWVAWDLLAQAEHDPLAPAVLASWSGGLLAAVVDRLAALPEAAGPLARGQFHLVRVDGPAEAVAFSDRMAPEHLHLVTERVAPEALSAYGSLFVGPWSPVALGDYVTGPNHTLPTAGVAAVRGGLSVGDFLRVQTWQRVSAGGFGALAPHAEALAAAEGLDAHAWSLAVRRGAQASGG